MKKPKEKKRKISWLLLVLLLSGACPLFGMDDPPDTISLGTLQQLYEPVEFDHAMHADGYDCSACHHHTLGEPSDDPVCLRCHATPNSGGPVACSTCHGVAYTPKSGENTEPYHIDKPGLKGALHLQCVGCHQEEGGPAGCDECHPFSPLGRKRFLVEKEAGG